jgi:hypothetical protein
MTTTLEEQQFTARILDALRPYFKQVFIAGGAPRNWKFGQSAKDLDIYAIQKHGINFTNDQLDVILRIALNEIAYTEDLQPPSDTYIFNYAHFASETGEDFCGQLMIVDEHNSIQSTLETFDIGLCMVAWDGVRYTYTDEYVKDILNKTLTYRRNNSKTDKHINKMKTYYPEYRTVEEVAVNPNTRK